MVVSRGTKGWSLVVDSDGETDEEIRNAHPHCWWLIRMSARDGGVERDARVPKIDLSVVLWSMADSRAAGGGGASASLRGGCAK